jgi:PAS domain S-box-containing protein
MPWTEPLANSDELRRCIRDLIALSTLSAAWRSYNIRQIGDSIVTALFSMLDADFVAIVFPAHRNEPITELARSSATLDSASLKRVWRILQHESAAPGSATKFIIPGPSAGSDLHVMTATTGSGSDATLAAGSVRNTFPTRTERLLLNTAANQAVIAFQQRLVEAENRWFTALAQRTTDFICIASLNGRIQYVNPAGLQLLGLNTVEEALRLEVRDFVSPRSRRTLEDELWPMVLRTGRWQRELDFNHFKSGAPISFLVDCFRIDDPRTGKPINIATVSRDLSNQKASETALRHLHETFERRVEERTYGLAEANQRLVADQLERTQADFRLQRLQNEVFQAARFTVAGQMAAALAHELNQPLTAVVNSVNAAKRLLANGGRADLLLAREVTGEAAEQALRASEIVRSLRQFLRRDEKQKRVEALAPMVEEACAFALRSIAPLIVHVRFEFDKNARSVLVNRVQIQQVLVNLIRNACEAMADQDFRQVTLATRALGDGMIEVTVADIGPGIAHDITDRLFSPFVSTKPDGMGMGLPISRSIVEAHGGHLTAGRDPQGGTIFRFTLPCDGAKDGA